jgi:hypothetical protein
LVSVQGNKWDDEKHGILSCNDIALSKTITNKPYSTLTLEGPLVHIQTIFDKIYGTYISTDEIDRYI